MSDSTSSPTHATSQSLDAREGQVIGERYRLLGSIGVGGMGAVYRAEHILMKKILALKLLRTDLGQREDAAKRFEREAQSASRLSHPNIISVTDFGQSAGGELFLAMEFVAGDTLADVLDREGRLAPARACGLAKQILSALEHAHAQGVVHRDLKPANVMLIPTSDPQKSEAVKILDFGIAKLIQPREGEEPLTQGVMVFGTPSYMAPEQAAGEEADPRSDLYSCGVMLYEMLTGRKPFVSDNMVKLLGLQITAKPPRFSEIAPEVKLPSDLEAVVMRALAKNRSERFPSAADFSYALSRAPTDMSALGAQLAVTSLRFGRAAGGKLWKHLPWIWQGPWALAKAAGRLKIRGDRAIGPWLKPLPGWLRPVVLPVLGLAVLAVALAVWPVSKGAAPQLDPPKPKPVAVEMRSPLRQIEEAMMKGRLIEARVLLMQQISAHPNLGRVRYLLGNLEFADKNPAAGMDAYEEALRLDPALRGDAALLVNVRSLLQDKRFGQAALQMMVKQIGKPACSYLHGLASEDRRMEFRHTARAAVTELSCPGSFDAVASYALDLQQGRTCDDRRQAASALGKTGDPRAIEPLKKARQIRGGLLGGILGGSGNACIRKEIDEALRILGVQDELPGKKGRKK